MDGKICDMMCDLVDALHTKIEEGLDTLDTHEAYEVVDMIKDLAEAKKYLKESEYYEHVITAMEDGDEVPYKPMVDQHPYVESAIKHTV